MYFFFLPAVSRIKFKKKFEKRSSQPFFLMGNIRMLYNKVSENRTWLRFRIMTRTRRP